MFVAVDPIFTAAIRRHRPGSVTSPQTPQPAPQVHVDHSTASAIAHIYMHLSPPDAQELIQKRFQIVNLWRPISDAALDHPPALCDYRSIDVKNDLVRTTAKFPNRDGETLSVRYNPNHSWKYLHGMTTDEFVVFKR